MFMVAESAYFDGNRYCGANREMGGINTAREESGELERKGA